MQKSPWGSEQKRMGGGLIESPSSSTNQVKLSRRGSKSFEEKKQKQVRNKKMS